MPSPSPKPSWESTRPVATTSATPTSPSRLCVHYSPVPSICLFKLFFESPQNPFLQFRCGPFPLLPSGDAYLYAPFLSPRSPTRPQRRELLWTKMPAPVGLLACGSCIRGRILMSSPGFKGLERNWKSSSTGRGPRRCRKRRGR